MNIEKAVLENLKQLPKDQQQEVLKFTQFLKQKISIPSPNHNLTPEQKAAKWIEWVQSHTSNNPPLPDEALHRDSMYD